MDLSLSGGPASVRTQEEAMEAIRRGVGRRRCRPDDNPRSPWRSDTGGSQPVEPVRISDQVAPESNSVSNISVEPPPPEPVLDSFEVIPEPITPAQAPALQQPAVANSSSNQSNNSSSNSNSNQSSNSSSNSSSNQSNYSSSNSSSNQSNYSSSNSSSNQSNNSSRNSSSNQSNNSSSNSSSNQSNNSSSNSSSNQSNNSSSNSSSNSSR